MRFKHAKIEELLASKKISRRCTTVSTGSDTPKKILKNVLVLFRGRFFYWNVVWKFDRGSDDRIFLFFLKKVKMQKVLTLYYEFQLFKNGISEGNIQVRFEFFILGFVLDFFALFLLDDRFFDKFHSRFSTSLHPQPHLFLGESGGDSMKEQLEHQSISH